MSQIWQDHNTAPKYHLHTRIICFLPPAFTPLILESSLILIARGSKKIVNKRGLRLQPCQVDLEMLNNGDNIPLVMTAAFGPVYNVLTLLQKLSPSLNFDKSVNKIFHSTLSKALWASSDISC